jgi:hypothetical protein
MRSNILPYPTTHSDESQPDDPVFFTKHQLRVGTALRYYGRTAPGSLWFVTGIYSNNKGKTVPRQETFPQTLDDLVRLHNHETGEVRFMHVIYLSYSAIWRIDE